MKIRNGFVSNSSSSSFIIIKDKLNDEQIDMLNKHIDIAEKIDEELVKNGKELKYEYYEEWTISDDDFSIWFSTSMDNFDLVNFAVDEVKVNPNDIIMIGDERYFYDLYTDDKYLYMRNKYLRHKKINKIINKIDN